MSPDEHDRLGHATSDARKRVQELIALEAEAAERANFDEQHAHADVDWELDHPSYSTTSESARYRLDGEWLGVTPTNIERGED